VKHPKHEKIKSFYEKLGFLKDSENYISKLWTRTKQKNFDPSSIQMILLLAKLIGELRKSMRLYPQMLDFYSWKVWGKLLVTKRLCKV
jgi:hypothetical protein